MSGGPVRLTYYLDVLSSWCLIAEPTLDRLRDRFADRLIIDWKIAVLGDGQPWGTSIDRSTWQYQRLHAVTGTQLNIAWRESDGDSSRWADLAAEAARSLGFTGDTVRRGIARAGMTGGEHVGRREVCAQVAARAASVPVERIDKAMDDPAVVAKLDETTREYRALGLGVVPGWVIENDIGDRALLGGLYEFGTLSAVVGEIEKATRVYGEFEAANPQPG